MNYWSDNPEKWDEICRKGIADRILTLLRDDGMDSTGFEHLTVDDVVRVLYDDSKLISALDDWAAPEIACFEADYWGSKIMEE